MAQVARSPGFSWLCHHVYCVRSTRHVLLVRAWAQCRLVVNLDDGMRLKKLSQVTSIVVVEMLWMKAFPKNINDTRYLGIEVGRWSTVSASFNTWYPVSRTSNIRTPPFIITIPSIGAANSD